MNDVEKRVFAEKKQREFETVEMTNMCAIINEKTNQVVVQNRIKSWKGITFPGGHVEHAESIVLSTIREIKEETGDSLKCCGMKDWYEEENKKRYIVFLFRTTSFKGTLLEETEEGKVYWQDIETLKEQNLSADFSEMIDIMLENKYAEFFYEETNNWTKQLY